MWHLEVQLKLQSPLRFDRIWLWICHNKIPIYPIFYLLQGDYSHNRHITVSYRIQAFTGLQLSSSGSKPNGFCHSVYPKRKKVVSIKRGHQYRPQYIIIISNWVPLLNGTPHFGKHTKTVSPHSANFWSHGLR